MNTSSGYHGHLYMKGGSHSDEPTEIYHSTLRLSGALNFPAKHAGAVLECLAARDRYFAQELETKTELKGE